MTTCSNCGHRNDDGAIFCVACNHYLEWDDAPRRRTVRRDRPADAAPESSDQPAERTPGQPPDRPARRQDPPPDHEAPFETAGPTARPRVSVSGLIAAIDEGQAIANVRNRPDLSRQLDRARTLLSTRRATTAVVGEFKRGKSTLINALLQTAVCPVDADRVTAVPTLVRFGDALQVTAYVQHGDGEPEAREASLPDITGLVAERDRPSGERVCSVEVRLSHRILRSGLCLLDTPGVGGLESADGELTLGALSTAQSLLFVTDASQELSGPELEFLQAALKRVPSAALVMTKVDLYPEWRRIVELDKEHLEHAGLDLPVIPVSSFLRLRAAHQPALNEESGFVPLAQFLGDIVMAPRIAQTTVTAAQEVDFVATQLARTSEAEQVVLARPEEATAVVAELARADRQARRLSSPTATWQQALSDGIQDLFSDVEHDLQTRLRAVQGEADSIIEQGDPKEMWGDTEAWLRRQLAAASVANRDLLETRARELSIDVAQEFGLAADTAFEIDVGGVTRALDGLELSSPADTKTPGGRFAPMLIAARLSFLVPAMVFSVAVKALDHDYMLPTAGLAGVLGVAIGSKLFKSEGERQRAQRQHSAKVAAHQLVDKVGFVMIKETRDTLRRTQRRLRDDLQARALSVQRSSTAALQAAQEASVLDSQERSVRSSQLASESERLQSMRTNVRELAGVAARSAAAGGLVVATSAAATYGLEELATAAGPADHAIFDGDHDG